MATATCALLGSVLDNADDDDEYEVDAQPFSPAEKDDGDDNSTDEAADDDGDDIVEENLAKPAVDDFKLENSSVEISNSSGVRFGHSITQKTDITFEKARSVVVDRRQWNYITYPDSSKVFLLLNVFFWILLTAVYVISLL